MRIVLIIMFFSKLAFAQDAIKIVNLDAFQCKIISVDKEKVVFNLGPVHRSVFRELVEWYKIDDTSGVTYKEVDTISFKIASSEIIRQANNELIDSLVSTHLIESGKFGKLALTASVLTIAVMAVGIPMSTLGIPVAVITGSVALSLGIYSLVYHYKSFNELIITGEILKKQNK